jgi:subtilisin family serine protease
MMRMLPFDIGSDALPPERLIGYVSVNSEGGTSLLDATDLGNAEPFWGTEQDQRDASRAAESAGLEVLAETRLGRAVAGPVEAYEELTGGRVVPRDRLVQTRARETRYVTHWDLVGPEQPPAFGAGITRSPSDGIEAVVIERPRFPQTIFPSPLPPDVGRFHLRVPDDVALVLGAEVAHRRGWFGQGVRVAMVDTGHYRHPFFVSRGYAIGSNVTVVPGTNAAKDPHGHGTGESANIFALAPGAELHFYRASDEAGNLVGAVAGFTRAKQDSPHVRTNSWGGDSDYPPDGDPDPSDKAIALEIRDAIQAGITVVFSAGNGHFSVEPQVPGVISAGGVYADAGLNLRASDYASGYQSPWFGGVQVPLVCGAVGLLPRAAYIMLPVPPGCALDVDQSADDGAEPGDGTGPNDGWALFSGTSAAAPQLAGAAAAILSAKPGLSPAQIAQALRETAIDVRAGHCHPRFNNLAGPGRDLATGYGLISTSAAADRATHL